MLRHLLDPTVAIVVTHEPGEVAALLPAEAACVENAVAKRRGEFAAGRWCARQALGELGVRDIDDFPLLPDPDRVPLWPPGVVGSISHSAGFCAAAATTRATTLGLGIDVERIAPLKKGLIPKICTAAEIARFAQLRDSGAPDWHKLTFSAKEAVYKAYFPLARTVLGFHDVDLVVDPHAGTFVGTLVREDAPAAAGARTFHGRWAFDDAYVYTAVTVPPN